MLYLVQRVVGGKKPILSPGEAAGKHSFDGAEKMGYCPIPPSTHEGTMCSIVYVGQGGGIFPIASHTEASQQPSKAFLEAAGAQLWLSLDASG